MRTRTEVKVIGIADAFDAHIPVRLLRDDYARSDRANTYRTRANPEFVPAVERLLEFRGFDRATPIIVMCRPVRARRSRRGCCTPPVSKRF